MRFKDVLNEARDTDPYKLTVDLYDNAFPFIKEFLQNFHITPNSDVFWSGRGGNSIVQVKKVRKDRQPKDTDPSMHYIIDDLFLSMQGERYRSNAIFVTGKYSDADSYGDEVYGIFPMGANYSYIFHNKIRDLYSDILDNGDMPFFGMDVDEVFTEITNNSEMYDDIWEAATDEASERWDEDEDDYKDEDGEFDEDAYDDARSEFLEREAESIYQEMMLERAQELVGSGDDEMERYISEYNHGPLKDAINYENEVMLHCDKYVMIRSDYIPFILRYMEINASRKPTPELWAMAMAKFDPKIVKRRHNSADFVKAFERHKKKGLLSIDDLIK